MGFDLAGGNDKKHVKGRPQDTWAIIVRYDAPLSWSYQRDRTALAESLADSEASSDRPAADLTQGAPGARSRNEIGETDTDAMVYGEMAPAPPTGQHRNLPLLFEPPHQPEAKFHATPDGALPVPRERLRETRRACPRAVGYRRQAARGCSPLSSASSSFPILVPPMLRARAWAGAEQQPDCRRVDVLAAAEIKGCERERPRCRTSRLAHVHDARGPAARVTRRWNRLRAGPFGERPAAVVAAATALELAVVRRRVVHGHALAAASSPPICALRAAAFAAPHELRRGPRRRCAARLRRRVQGCRPPAARRRASVTRSSRRAGALRRRALPSEAPTAASRTRGQCDRLSA